MERNLVIQIFLPKFWDPTTLPNWLLFSLRSGQGGLHFFWGVGESLGGFIKTDASFSVFFGHDFSFRRVQHLHFDGLGFSEL